jgi:hypothetical protein
MGGQTIALRRTESALAATLIGIAISLTLAMPASGSANTNGTCRAFDSMPTSAPYPVKTSPRSVGWSAEKTAYLPFYTDSLHDLTTTLGSAPRNVMTAATVLVTYLGRIKIAVEKSRSYAQFLRAAAAVPMGPRYKSAEGTLHKYIMGQCGSSPL